MKLRSILATALLTLTVAAATASAAGEHVFSPQRPVTLEMGRTCGAPEPTSFEMDAVASALRRYIEEGRAGATGQIKVAWHVISSGTTGNIPDSQIDRGSLHGHRRLR